MCDTVRDMHGRSSAPLFLQLAVLAIEERYPHEMKNKDCNVYNICERQGFVTRYCYEKYVFTEYFA